MRVRIATWVGLLALPVSICAMDVAPSWIQEVSTRATPNYPPRVPASVLLSEERVTVEPTGKITTITRKAIRILNQEGRSQANAGVSYFSGSGRVKELRAWVIAPGGFVKAFGKESIADVGVVGEDLYNEARVRVLHVDKPEIGAVFAYEAEVEQSALFAQDEYFFQNALPAMESRYVLTLPAGWKASGVVFNHEPIEPVVDGSTYTWALRGLPFRFHEPGGPIARATAPRLAVTFIPPSNGSTGTARCLMSWTDASKWMSDLIAGRDAANDEMATKVRELTAGSPTEYDKIRAIGTYVQGLKYVSIQMNLAQGGGYQPHPASAVFQKQYGDCKDKANLMRALLKVAGIQSYLVALFAGDRTLVREDWPSPQQFNHAIVAVHIGDETQASTVIAHPSLGRLLIFDPTNPLLPVGDLPAYEQNSFGLIAAGDKGGLIRLPVTPPHSNVADVSVEGELSELGEFKASMTDEDRGQPAVELRSAFRAQNPEDHRRVVEHWLNRTAKTVQVTKIEPSDAFVQGVFKLRVEFTAENYGQAMQGRLLMFKPSVVAPRRQIVLPEERRTTPVLLYGETYQTHVRVKLPPNFKVDEMPDAKELESPYGKFACSYKADAGELLATEELTVRNTDVPPDQYRQVRKFFADVQALEQQLVVLVKQ